VYVAAARRVVHHAAIVRFRGTRPSNKNPRRADDHSVRSITAQLNRTGENGSKHEFDGKPERRRHAITRVPNERGRLVEMAKLTACGDYGVCRRGRPVSR